MLYRAMYLNMQKDVTRAARPSLWKKRTKVGEENDGEKLDVILCIFFI